MNVLALGAHPDDIEFGCGGTLIHYTEKHHRVFAMILTRGEHGGDPQVREREQIDSANILQVEDVFFGGYTDTELLPTRNLIIDIERTVKRVNPDLILVNHFEDTHQDHRNLAQAAISATRHIKNVLFYETVTSQNFIPNLFVDIESVLSKKLASLEAHTSQITKNVEGLSILDIARSTANFRGIQGKVKFAEGFHSARFFITI